MKRANSITGKILLFVMIFFVMHDFVIRQSDSVTSKQETLKICSISSSVAGALDICEEHVFHESFLLNGDNYTIEKSTLQKNIYSLNSFIINEIHIPLFTPPKNI